MSERRHNTAHVPDVTRLPKCVNGWKPYSEDDLFEDGTQLLAAVPVCGIGDKWYYSLDVVTLRCDEDYSDMEDANGDTWGWDLSDCDFYVELCK